MGTGASQESHRSSADRRSREIDRLLSEAKTSQSKHIKLLLLGASESGKSTLTKQMRIIYQNGYLLEDRLSFRPIIYRNLRSFIQMILKTMEKNDPESEIENWPLESQSFLSWYVSTTDSEGSGLSPEVADAIKRLWDDPAVRNSFDTIQHSPRLISAPYFFQTIDRLAGDMYVPTDEDILRSRQQATNITETAFQLQQYTVSLCDVGGQKTERRKWIHCFDNITAILFMVAMSHYDQVLDQDGKTNRLEESLSIFKWVNEQDCFQDTSIIVLLNHKDILERKILKSPFSAHFADYTGVGTYEDVSEFIKNKFQKIAKQNQKDIYSHFTNAINTHDTEVVLQDCMSVILKSHIEDSEMY